MKAIVKNVRLEVAIAGDGGYANQSSLSIKVEGIGQINLPDPWDMSPLALNQIEGWELSIPSGTLTAKYGVTAEWGDDTVTFVAEEAIWDGKQAGFFGGMSGYGSFGGSLHAVKQGTYMLPEDVPGMRKTSAPLDFSAETRQHWHQVDWATYQKRHSRHKDAIGYDLAHEDASEAARILYTPEDDRSAEEIQYLKQFHAQIRAIDALTDEEFVETCADRRVETSTPAIAEDLPQELVSALIKVYPTLTVGHIALARHWALLCADRYESSHNGNRDVWVIEGENLPKQEIFDVVLRQSLNDWELSRVRAARSQRVFDTTDEEYEDYEGADEEEEYDYA